MHGFSSHAYRMHNARGQEHYVKFHIRTDQGIRNLSAASAAGLAAADPDYATRDLFHAIARGDFPSWSLLVQLATAAELQALDYDALDVTKVWPRSRFPLRMAGRITLDRNVQNYHAEVEQAAFSPSHTVPGILPSEDRMLQGRLFSYPDTHRHRLGANYTLLPINRPRCPVSNQQRDGAMRLDGNGGSAPNYEPQSISGGAPARWEGAAPAARASAAVARHRKPLSAVDFRQPGDLYGAMAEPQRAALVENVSSSLGRAKRFIRERQLGHFAAASAELGRRLEASLLRSSF